MNWSDGAATHIFNSFFTEFYCKTRLCETCVATIGCYSILYERRVSVLKIFLRGNRCYVGVQVPKSMQGGLKRKEYWISLQTSDRSVVLQHAAAAKQEKHREVAPVFRRLSDVRETFLELDVDRQLALGLEAYARHINGSLDLVTEFNASDFDTLKDFIAARAETIVDLVNRLRVVRAGRFQPVEATL